MSRFLRRLRHEPRVAEQSADRVSQRSPRGRSLMAKLVLTFLALSLLMVGIVGTISYLRARSSLQGQVFDRLNAAEQLKADSLDRWLDEQRRNVVFVGGLLGGYLSGDAGGLAQATQTVINQGSASAKGKAAHNSVESAFKYIVSQ